MALAHPEALDAVVFGVPDDDRGERLVAVMRPVDGVAARTPSWSAHCRPIDGRPPDIKTPKPIEFVEDFPRRDTGKVQEHRLRCRRGRPRPASS